MDEILLEAYTIEDIEDTDDMMDEIMKRYGQEILQLVFSYVKNSAVAEDLTQDIFVKCYKSLHTYNRKAKLRTWLWRIAINHCKDYLKSWYNKKVIFSETALENVPTKRETIEQSVNQKDEDEKLASAVMDLPIKYREVIFLFYYEDMPLKEIAEVTQVNENTVKTRLRRAKELLKKELEDEQDGR